MSNIVNYIAEYCVSIIRTNFLGFENFDRVEFVLVTDGTAKEALDKINYVKSLVTELFTTTVSTKYKALHLAHALVDIRLLHALVVYDYETLEKTVKSAADISAALNTIAQEVRTNGILSEVVPADDYKTMLEITDFVVEKPATADDHDTWCRLSAYHRMLFQPYIDAGIISPHVFRMRDTIRKSNISSTEHLRTILAELHRQCSTITSRPAYVINCDLMSLHQNIRAVFGELMVMERELGLYY